MAGASAGALTFAGLGGLAVTAAPAHATAAVTLTTTAGADRYASAGNVNQLAYPGGVSEVVLADGLPGHQGDALAAAGYAGVNGYGILLTDNTNSVPANTLTALTTLKVKTIQPVGGTAAISAAELAQLSAAGYTVLPTLAGATSLATMQAIDDAIPVAKVGTSGTPAVATAILASVDENHLVDALSASGMSFAKKFPVITTESSGTALSPEATQVIGALGIKKLIVVGGTASIPASQYTPDPTGVTAEDISATTGADRSATSELLEKDEVANYGASNSQLAIAAGATFVGSTTAVQNDGADALASAPFTGGFMPTCVTDGPTNAGSVAQCGTDLASTLTQIFALTGTANLPTSQLTPVCTAAGGSCTTSTSTSNAYTVTPALSLTPATPTASTAAAPTQGVETYTVTGLPSSGTVNIALFPCTGTAQTGNGPTNGAPGVNSSGGTTFTAPGGTTPAAGNAIGQGTSTGDGSPATAGAANGSVNSGGGGGTNPLTHAAYGPYSSSAYVASVNGVPTANVGNGNQGPTQVYGIATTGTLSFVLNSFSTDCAIPVVYTAPTGTGATPALLVNSNGTPQTGYAVGEGGITYWQAPAAPSTIAGAPYSVSVISVNATANMFAAAVLGGGPAGAVGNIYSFNYGTAGSTYFYTDGTPLTMASFGGDLSGAGAPVVPNGTTTVTVNGDGLTIGTGTGYASGAPANFAFTAVLGGDVPAAPTNVSATYNGAAYTAGTVSEPGVVVTWTPPVNQDVSGAQAVAPGAGAYNAGNAIYNVWRSTVSGTTTSVATLIGSVVVISTGTPNNGDGQATTGCTAVQSCTSIASPEFIDTTAPAGSEVLYYVTAQAAVPSGGGVGPFSTGSTGITAGTGVGAPVIESVDIAPGTTVVTAQPPIGGSPTVTGTPGSALVTYNEGVNCNTAAAATFSYSNPGGTPTPITGATCALEPAGNQLLITFPSYYPSGGNSITTGLPIVSGTNVTAPGTGSTFTYTAPGTNTTSTAVYAGQTSAPQYGATQTVSDNGSPSATTNTGTLTSPSNPLFAQPVMVSATHGAGGTTFAVTYNEIVACPTTTWPYSGAAAGTPITACAGGGTTTLTYSTTGSVAGTLTYTAPATSTAANAVSADGVTEFAPTQSVTAN